MTPPEHQLPIILAPVVYMNPIDRFAEFIDALVDRLTDAVEPKPVAETRPKWWIVTSSTTTHLVITDGQRSVIIAPRVWNTHIGGNLDDLLTKHHARAVPIPGPYPEAQP